MQKDDDVQIEAVEGDALVDVDKDGDDDVAVVGDVVDTMHRQTGRGCDDERRRDHFQSSFLSLNSAIAPQFPHPNHCLIESLGMAI